MEKNRLFLIDAFAMIYRAYFAYIKNPLINSKGVNTSAISGFTSFMNEILTKEKPTHIAVVFDVAGPTERDNMVDFYKANREEMPEDIRNSIEPIKEIIKAFGIPCIGIEGYEADDTIGALAKMAEQKGFQTFMVTPDKDYGQLVSENIFMYRPKTRGGGYEVMGIEEVCAKWDIERVDQVIDMLGLMGDAVDNIPGIKGVGEKTAAKLLKQFDTLEGILANTESIKGKLKEKVEAGKADALISKQLATIILDVPVEFNEEELLYGNRNTDRLAELFTEYEFRTLGKRILGDEFRMQTSSATQPDLFTPVAEEVEEPVALDIKTIENTPHEYHLVDTQEKRSALLKKMLQAKEVCFDTETTGLDPMLAEIVGFSLAVEEGEAYYIPTPADFDAAKAILEEFNPLWNHELITKIAQNIKYDLLMLKRYGIELKGPMFDTMLAHFLIEPSMRHNMDVLAESYLAYHPISIETLIGKKGSKQGNMRDADLLKVTEYAAEDADVTLKLKNKFVPLLQSREVRQLFDEVETPLISVLAEMELNGIKVDKDFLGEYSEELGKDQLSLRTAVFEMAGQEFNLNSPAQLGKVLFDEMGIPYKGKKTKTGAYSTNEETLSNLAGDNDIVAKILEYRECTKLKSTYVDAIPALIHPVTGRVHTTYSQTVAVTGRLSSNNPNLQNIPIRTERGRRIRKAFVPASDNHLILSADYSQIELRIMAAMSEDEAMMEAFNNNIDIHSTTASKVYGVALSAVTAEMRRSAKMVNFGIIYGISAFGLSQRLGVPRKEAAEIIDGYFEQFPKVKTFMDKCIQEAREAGYVKTILGRKRYLRDINSKNYTVRSNAERNAINSPIQGSAADLIKLAMMNVHNQIKTRQLQSKLCLQVHDELVLDVLKSEQEEIEALVIEQMQNALQMKVQMKAEMGVGQNWLEAH